MTAQRDKTRAVDPFTALRDEINRATELAGRPPKQVRVTVVAIPGAIMDVPMLDKNGRPRPRAERQMLVHPDDWEVMRAHMRATIEAAGLDGTKFDEEGKVLLVCGLPVVEGEQ